MSIKLQAVHLIGRRIEIPTKPNEKPRYGRQDVPAGEFFDVETREEAEGLIADGAAVVPAKKAKLVEQTISLPPLPDNLDAMSVPELKRLAGERKVQLPRSADTVPEIVVELRKQVSALR